MSSIKTEILQPAWISPVLGSDGRYNRVVKPYQFRSTVLFNLGLHYEPTVPEGFINDLESIPFFRGTAPEAGIAHDYLSRTDSYPLVSKAVAAEVYLEMLRFVYSFDDCYGLKGTLERMKDNLKMYPKYKVVRYWPGYYHRYPVEATYDQINRKMIVRGKEKN